MKYLKVWKVLMLSVWVMLVRLLVRFIIMLREVISMV